MPQFLGSRKIHTIEDINEEEKKITLKDQTVYVLPNILVEKMVFDMPSKIDGAEKPEDFAAWKLSTIASDLILLLTKTYKLRVKEIEMLISFIQNKVNNDFNLAQMILWKKGHYEITLQDVREIIEKSAKEELEKAKENNAILQDDINRGRMARGR